MTYYTVGSTRTLPILIDKKDDSSLSESSCKNQRNECLDYQDVVYNLEALLVSEVLNKKETFENYFPSFFLINDRCSLNTR